MRSMPARSTTLRARGLVYACSCSRSAVAQQAGAARRRRPWRFRRPDAAAGLQASRDAEVCYPGTCAHRQLADGPGVGLRVRLEPSIERFVDLRLGPQAQRPSDQCGDLLARDRDGNWTYQFAATVDDYVQGITLVIRGVDLLSSTGRQIHLARLLGRETPPAFLHHALIMKGSGTSAQKLSKSDGDTGIGELRARGWTPAQVIAHAMAMVGVPRPIAGIVGRLPPDISYHGES